MNPLACPCGYDLEFARCCQPFLEGDALPATAEALMRSRYSAHVLGLVDYILETICPRQRGRHDPDRIRSWCKTGFWQGLRIVHTQRGGFHDRIGRVSFEARYLEDGRFEFHRECSLFRKENGRWFFVEGEEAPKPQKKAVKLGRNDPCPCDSGKKYKRCCAAAPRSE